jgi:hypothetical protein
MTAGRVRARVLAAAAVALIAVGCTTPTPSTSPSSRATELPTASATPNASQAPSSSAAPSATPAPSLSLEPPGATDARIVTVSVEPQLRPDSDGRIVVAVTSRTETRIDELVLRWPTALVEAAFLAPFTPSDDRIREGGPPLVQPWTKWVIGPGEQGEPAGTTSLGWGPLLPGATLTIPIVVTRTGGGPVSFDLQVLAGNDLLTLDGGAPADLRVELP